MAKLTKAEAVKEFVARDVAGAVPQGWVRIVAESEGDYPALPMWGTMWIVDGWIGDKLMQQSRVMASEPNEIDLDAIEGETERAKVAHAIAQEGWRVLEDYVDEEMAGERCVLDNDGNTTSLFIYEIGDEFVIGVNGAGWDFYHGVWDKLYDIMGLHWHEVAA